MHSPSTRLCSRWYCCGSAGLARLTARAIESAFQYETNAIAPEKTSAMMAHDRTGAEQQPEGPADERQQDDEAERSAARCAACWP